MLTYLRQAVRNFVLLFAANLLSTSYAAINVTISSVGPQSGGSFVGRVWTPTSSPSVIVVSNLLAELESGNVTVQTTGALLEAGDITIASTLPLDDLVTVASRTLTLNAANHINVDAPIIQNNPGGNAIPNVVSLTFNADSDVNGTGSVLINGNVDTAGGNFTATGVNFGQTPARVINTGGGAITITGSGSFTLSGVAINSAGGPVTLTAGTGMTINAPCTTSGGAFNASVSGVGALTIASDITTTGGSVVITTANGLLQSTAGSTVDVFGGAGSASLRLESLAAAAHLTLAGSVVGAGGSLILRAGGDVNVNAPVSGFGAMTLRGNSDNGGSGNLNISAAVTATGSGTLTLRGANFSQSGTGTVSSANGAITGTFTGLTAISRAITSTGSTVTFTGGVTTMSAPISGSGGVSVTGNGIVGNAGGTLTAQNHAIVVNSPTGAIDILDAISSNGGAITVTAFTTLDLGPALISSGGGGVSLTSVNSMTLFGPIVTSSGGLNADVTGVGTLSIQNDITTTGGSVDITTLNGLLQSTTGSDINVSGGAGAGSIRLEALGGATDVLLNGGIVGGGGAISLRGGNHVTLNAPVTSFGATTIAADTNNGGVGNIAIAAPITISGAAALTLSARSLAQSATGTISANGGSITGTFADAITVARPISSTSGAIHLSAPATTLPAAISGGGGVTIQSANITGNAGGTISSQNAPIVLAASAGAADIVAAINSHGGDITITAGTALTLGPGLLTSAGGKVALSSASAMTLFGPISTSGGHFTTQVSGAGTLSLQNDVTTSGGNVTMTAANGLLRATAGSDINAGSGAGTSSVFIESTDGAQDVSLGGTVASGAGGITVRAGNHLTLSSTVTSSGAIVLDADTNNGGIGDVNVNGAVGAGAGGIVFTGRGFVQTGTGTLSTAGGPITGRLRGATTLASPFATNGGEISVLAPGGITVNALLSTAPPVGGTGVLHTTAGVVINTTPVLGNANITLQGIACAQTYIAGATCNLDVDGDGAFSGSDALLTMRRILGYSSNQIAQGLTFGICAMRTTGPQLANHIDAQLAPTGPGGSRGFDIDGDGAVRAATDGLIISRIARGLTGSSIAAKATNPTAPRNVWDLVRPYLNGSCGTNLAP